MFHCQICNAFKEARGFNAYKRECRDCRRARRKLIKDGVSLKAMKTYLAEVGIKADFPVVDNVPEPAVSFDMGRRKRVEAQDDAAQNHLAQKQASEKKASQHNETQALPDNVTLLKPVDAS